MSRARLPSWRSALAAAVETHRRALFRFGAHDCGVLSGDAVLGMTGFDVVGPFRGRYTTMAGALRVLRKAGHADHVALFAAHLAEIHPAQARMGDIAVVPCDEGQALGPVVGAEIAVFAPGGLAFLPLVTATRAFRVGHG